MSLQRGEMSRKEATVKSKVYYKKGKHIKLNVH